MNIISKDNRENAWKINIRYSKESISIEHHKKELGMNNNFSFAWSVKYFFFIDQNGDIKANPDKISFHFEDFVIEEDTSLPHFAQLEKFFYKHTKSKKSAERKIKIFAKSNFFIFYIFFFSLL